jgi:peptidoglycan/xylan/chitin deacetylase (PgdA/CDA1 family)
MAAAERVFLMFHELELPGRPLCQPEPGYARYTVRAEDFRSQMNWLRQAGWTGFSVSQAFTAPETRAVVITFDDGCETDLLVAAPVLKEAGFGATSYITVGFVGKPGYLSASQVRELSQSSIEVGCHSMSHPHLNDLRDQSLHEEIVVAKDRLQQMIGRSVDHFSCPGGRWNQRVVAKVQEAGYKTMATSRTHANSPTGNPFCQGRVVVMRATNLPAFQAICEGRGLWRLSARNRVRDGAKRILGNTLYDRVRAGMLR